MSNDTKFNWSYYLSFLVATWIGCKLKIREPYSLISEKPKTTTAAPQIWLGAALLHNSLPGSGSVISPWFEPHSLTAFLSSNNISDLVVVQVLEPSEKNTPIAGLTPTNKETNLPGKTINTKTLRLPDFSYGYVPPTEYIESVGNIYNELFTPNSRHTNFYFHCKAGVNRSFRTAAIIQTLRKIEAETNERGNITLSHIAKISWETCNNIKKARSCVDFHPDNYLIQASFVATAVATILKTKNKLSSPEDNIDGQYGLAKYILAEQIEALCNERRENNSDYLSWVATLFGTYSDAIPKNQKIEAQEKLIGALRGASQALNAKDIAALFDGRTGNVLLNAPQAILPEGLQQPYEHANNTLEEDLSVLFRI